MRCVISIAILSLFAGACDRSETTKGEPCDVDKDCWHKQECARTSAERSADLPGVCEDKGTGCLVGQQLGCACDPADSSMDCSFPALSSSTIEYPEMMCEPTQLVCVPASVAEMTEG